MHAAAYYSRTIGRVFAEGGDKNSTDSWSESTRIISNRAGIPWNEEAVRFAFIDTFVVQSIIITVASVSREGGKTLDYLHSFALLNETRGPIPYPIDPIISALLDKEENLGCAKPFGDFAQLL